ncbi:unnamed protein product [[Actinomadura] parvosata subsp. kistnae]|nr:unnamed protein product [Actinomadura parvosata subsp. kistnae]
MVPQGDQLPAQMAEVDPLTATGGLAAVGQKRDPQRSLPHGHPFLRR